MTVNRERKIISASTGYEIHIAGNTIDQAIQLLERMKTQFGGTAQIEKISEYGDEYLVLYVDRLETDQEMKRRIRDEERREARQAERDRVEFERLKSKFGQ